VSDGRLHITVPSDVGAEVDAIVKREASTKTDVVRRALMLYVEASAVVEDGGKVVFVDAEGKATRVMLLIPRRRS
jgi:metal-responsive CopG/Arc/MetJ family transcriptional regulator